MEGDQAYEVGNLRLFNSQALELFDVLIRDRIEGLPSHITKMSIHLNITVGLWPQI